jgi:potassium uptake TrkH family protein
VRVRRPRIESPARLIPIAFLLVIALGTGLLMLPAAKQGPGGASPLVAFFTSASSVCVNGLVVVDTPTYWSGFGQALITALTQLGGFGIMTMATLLTLLVSDRIGLRTRLLAQAEEKSLGLADVRGVLLRVALTMLVCETVIAVFLAGRFWLAYDRPLGTSLWYGVFHAVSAFNNAGFALFSDSLVGFVGDWWICLPLVAGVILGSLGFPVLFELARRRLRTASWSMHTRITVFGSLALLAVGFVVMLLFEWSNPATFGPLGVTRKVLAAVVQGTMPRSGGFNSVDFGAMNAETIAVTNGLMFIGGGSASTAGGIKVTTFFVLAFVIFAEIRGEPDVVIGRRRVSGAIQRQAITVALLGVAIVAAGALALVAVTTGIPFDRALFEVISAFGTVGLSTGLTPHLPPAAQLILVVLMFVGRIGTITVASAIALNTRSRLYRFPEERPIVG